MQKLIQGIINFRAKSTEEQKNRFAMLALGQSPDALFICCSDSRVAPNVFASTDPGDLFVVRNVGNLIPLSDAKGRSTSDRSEAAAIEFAVSNLQVRDIIVCGHSECGAMRALLAGPDKVPWPNLKSWINAAQPALTRCLAGEEVNANMSDVNRLSQLNAIEQAEHVKSYPVVQERIEAGTLRVHSWWFDIARGEVLAYDAGVRSYKPVGHWVGS